MTPQPEKGHAAIEVLSGYSKLTIDWMKHSMTLSTGIIVVVATFRDHIQNGAIAVWALPSGMLLLMGLHGSGERGPGRVFDKICLLAKMGSKAAKYLEYSGVSFFERIGCSP
jgi:hypothetical protein